MPDHNRPSYALSLRVQQDTRSIRRSIYNGWWNVTRHDVSDNIYTDGIPPRLINMYEDLVQQMEKAKKLSNELQNMSCSLRNTDPQ